MAVVIIGFLIVDESLPQGNQGPEAEALAEKMLNAIGHEQWDEIPIISWSFRGEHYFVWDKKNHCALVEWDDYSVALNLNGVTGKVRKGDAEIFGDEAENAVQTAYAFWCNDSFWLNAPAKIKDGGTVRKIVKYDQGPDRLLVQYMSGGVTPGDAYLWELNEEYLPVSYKMWVSIIPIGGVEATWEGWTDFDGAMIATSHKLGPLEIPLTDLKTGNSLSDFGLSDSLFMSFN